MTAPAAPLEIRSYRNVFALERRIYRIDTLRLNPAGVPLRGIVYAVVLVLLALLAAAVPPMAWLLAPIPWYAKNVAAPLALATLFASMRIEARPFHLAGAALLAHSLGAAQLSSLEPRRSSRPRWAPPDLLLIPDGSDARFRRLRYRGPGAVLISLPHLRAEWSRLARADVTLHPLEAPSAPTRVIELARGAVLEVRRD